MKRSTILILGVIIIAVVAAASIGSGGWTTSSTTATNTQYAAYTEDPYTARIPIQGSLLGRGYFNGSYCSPACKYAEAQDNNEPRTTTTRTTATTSQVNCGTATNPLNCYVSTHTNSNQCFGLCSNTFSSISCNTNDPLCIYIQSKSSATGTSSWCGPLCQFTRTGTSTTTTVSQPLPSQRKNVAVVLAAFSDLAPTRNPRDIERQWNRDVASYYHDVSHGQFDAAADIYGWFTLPNNEAYYGADCPGIGIDCGITQGEVVPFSWRLAVDAVGVAELSGLNLTNYQYLVVIHSGNGEESSGVSNDVWSVTYFVGPQAGTQAQGAFTEYSIVPETEFQGLSPLGVWSAEFGHQQGWPDMFQQNEDIRAQAGHWELESLGTWNGNPPGSLPAFTAGLNQYNSHWIQHNTIILTPQGSCNPTTCNMTFRLYPLETQNPGNRTLLIEVVSRGYPYHVWLELRTQTGWDRGIPESGVILGEIYSDFYAIDASHYQIISQAGPHFTNDNDPTLAHAAWQPGQHISLSLSTLITIGSINSDGSWTLYITNP